MIAARLLAFLGSPQLAAWLLAALVAIAGTVGVASIVKSVREGVRASIEANWLRRTAEEKAKSDRAIEEANRKAAEAAQRAREAAEGEEAARKALSELEAVLAAQNDDPVAFPADIVKELRR